MADPAIVQAVRDAWAFGEVTWEDDDVALRCAEADGMLDQVPLRPDGTVPASEVRRIAWRVSSQRPWLVKPPESEQPAHTGPVGASGASIGTAASRERHRFHPPPPRQLRRKYQY